MAEEKKEAEKEEEVIELSDFFTMENEEAGTWMPVYIYGRDLGIELQVLGSNSVKNTRIVDEMKKKVAAIAGIEDADERAKAYREWGVENAARRVVGLRGKEGKKPLFKGKVLEYSDKLIRELIRNIPDLGGSVLEYSGKSVNFTNGKMN